MILREALSETTHFEVFTFSIYKTSKIRIYQSKREPKTAATYDIVFLFSLIRMKLQKLTSPLDFQVRVQRKKNDWPFISDGN